MASKKQTGPILDPDSRLGKALEAISGNAIPDAMARQALRGLRASYLATGTGEQVGKAIGAIRDLPIEETKNKVNDWSLQKLVQAENEAPAFRKLEDFARGDVPSIKRFFPSPEPEDGGEIDDVPVRDLGTIPREPVEVQAMDLPAPVVEPVAPLRPQRPDRPKASEDIYSRMMSMIAEKVNQE